MADPTPITTAAPQAGTAAPAVPENGLMPGKGGDANMSEALAHINRDLKEKAVAERAQQLGISYIDMDKIPINPDLVSIVPLEKAEESILIPFFRIGKKLRVAVSDPQKASTQALIVKLKTQGYALNVNLASDDSIGRAIQRLYADVAKLKKAQLVTQVESNEVQAYEQELANLAELPEKLKGMMAEEALNLINVGAMKTGSSDIHIQPEETTAIVRFRIDGFLQKVMELDPKTYSNITNQLKYKAGMKLNITNVPQDGRYFFTLNEGKIDVRVSALPTEYGETFVCRLLDSGKKFLSLEECDFLGRNLELMKRAITLSHGMVLVTGPTGSGKTTTLYSMLQQFNRPEVKIVTLEDPIEYHLKGITQSQINEKRGYTFANGLRSILRQDPDVVMVGEIRDLETAETAAQAALTGHVLLSTLHTNSALETLPRLINIGLPAFMVAPSLHMVVAQRLVRKLCDQCKQKKPITEVEREELERICAEIKKVDASVHCEIPTELWHPRECKVCSHTGYAGRIGIHEILVVDDAMRELILKEATPTELFEKARGQKMLTLKEDGILKVLAEKTTLEEVHRVTTVLSDPTVTSAEAVAEQAMATSITPDVPTQPQVPDHPAELQK